MAIETEDRPSSLSGLTAAEAKEFHRLFMTSFIGFVVVALVAHLLAWIWRPWLPPVGGYSALVIDGAKVAANTAMSFLA